MLKEIHFVSYQQFLALQGRADTIAISITDRLYEGTVAEGYHDVLRLQFADYDPVRDTPLTCQHPFTPVHAALVREWITVHHAAAVPLILLVHCWAGISRSAAIAWWAHQKFGAALKTRYPAYHLNRFVLHQLDGAMAAPPIPAGSPSREQLIHEFTRQGSYVAEHAGGRHR